MARQTLRSPKGISSSMALPKLPVDIQRPTKLIGKARSGVPASRVEKGGVLRDPSLYGLYQDIDSIRFLPIHQQLRYLSTRHGTFSAALTAYTQLANSGFSLHGYEAGTTQFSTAATCLAHAVMSRLDTLHDYTAGFSDRPGVELLIDQGLRETALTGAVCSELVLNNDRLPERIQLFDYSSIEWRSNGASARYPVQKGFHRPGRQGVSGGRGSSTEISLDIPTVFISESERHASESRAHSMFEPAIEQLVHYSEFIQDIRRVVRQSGPPRVLVKLDAEKVRAMAPVEIASDPDKLSTYMNAIKAEVETTLKGLDPEDALVFYDTAEVDNADTTGSQADYRDLLNALSGLTATSLKSHPSVLGMRLEGSQALGNVESLVFLKTARILQRPVETVMSRLLTLAVRLYGSDAYIKFKFAPINLRPEAELEAFTVMRQTRLLELLSLGFLTDDEAAAEMGTGDRPPLSPPLSGTMFHGNSTVRPPSPATDPFGREASPDVPASPGGRDNEQRPARRN